METIHDRIKKVRLSEKLDQEQFSISLNLKRNSISLIENKKRNPSDRTIADLCREFNINEDWLRTGNGGDENMYFHLTSSEKAYNKFGYIMENSAPSKKAALSILLELLYEFPDEKWDLIVNEYMEQAKGCEDKKRED